MSNAMFEAFEKNAKIAEHKRQLYELARLLGDVLCKRSENVELDQH